MLDNLTLRQSPWLRLAMSIAHRTAALRTRDCSPSAASYVAPSVVVADVARTAAAVSASRDSPGLDVEVAGGDEGKRWVVVGDTRMIPCRIEEGGEESAAASQGERREGRRKCEWSGGMEGTGAAVARRRQRRVPAELMLLACCPCLRMTCQPMSSCGPICARHSPAQEPPHALLPCLAIALCLDGARGGEGPARATDRRDTHGSSLTPIEGSFAAVGG
jgi:hypothetical protein